MCVRVRAHPKLTLHGELDGEDPGPVLGLLADHAGDLPAVVQVSLPVGAIGGVQLRRRSAYNRQTARLPSDEQSAAMLKCLRSVPAGR